MNAMGWGRLAKRIRRTFDERYMGGLMTHATGRKSNSLEWYKLCRLPFTIHYN
jgi:hypothetical protein